MLRLALCALLLTGACAGQGSSCGRMSSCVTPTLCRNFDRRSVRLNTGEVSKCNDNEVCCNDKDIMEEQQRSRDDPGCGRRNADALMGLTASNETEFGEFPWHVAILRLVPMAEYTQITFHCGGSLIHPRVVLTAAHNVYLQKAEELRVRAGEWEPHSTAEPYPHQDNPAKEIIIHENFHRSHFLNDVALIILESPYIAAPHINTICLPISEIEPTDETCFVTGWGKAEFQQFRFAARLRKIDLKVHSRNQCNDMLRRTRLGSFFSLHSSSICAGGDADKDFCTGDGGSALICPIPSNENYYYQVGIMSWGIGCGQANVPGVYTNVGKFRRWIDTVMLNRHIIQ